jgi:hypothetical protein
MSAKLLFDPPSVLDECSAMLKNDPATSAGFAGAVF